MWLGVTNSEVVIGAVAAIVGGGGATAAVTAWFRRNRDRADTAQVLTATAQELVKVYRDEAEVRLAERRAERQAWASERRDLTARAIEARDRADNAVAAALTARELVAECERHRVEDRDRMNALEAQIRALRDQLTAVGVSLPLPEEHQ